jgi:hypothetical protein
MPVVVTTLDVDWMVQRVGNRDIAMRMTCAVAVRSAHAGL